MRLNPDYAVSFRDFSLAEFLKKIQSEETVEGAELMARFIQGGSMPALDINGTSLEYSESGKGKALVLVHGSASDYRTWHLQQAEFAKHFRVIAYSRRYHWPNKPIPDNADYSMSEHVDDLEALLTSLLITSQHSAGLFRVLADRLEALLPHAERTQIDDTLHLVHEDAAPDYNEAVLSFLSSRRQAAVQ